MKCCLNRHAGQVLERRGTPFSGFRCFGFGYLLVGSRQGDHPGKDRPSVIGRLKVFVFDLSKSLVRLPNESQHFLVPLGIKADDFSHGLSPFPVSWSTGQSVIS